MSSQTQTVHERRRDEIVATIPAWYRPWVHLTIPTALGLLAMVGSLVLIRDLRAIELCTIPVTLLLAFALEWRTHKSVLHRRMPGLSLLYERHELAHHVIYTHEDMAMRSAREMWLILMPAYAVVLVFLIDLPFAFGAGMLCGRNAGCIFLATSMFFFLTYEWMHLSYHLPPESAVGRNPLIARLRRLHQRHHDPSLMKRWNFNVTFPVFDWVHGTVWSPDREAAVEAKRAERRRRAEAHG